MKKLLPKLEFLENNLLIFVIIVTAIGLIRPELGQGLENFVSPFPGQSHE